MKKYLLILPAMLFTVACARVNVVAPKDPIKLDVSMRMDIYQHVEKDINSIEDQVAGKDKHSLLEYIISDAYADEDGLGVGDAVSRRKARHADLAALEAGGIIGENSSGLVEVKGADPSASGLVAAENSDRMDIYNAVAQKHGTSVDDVKKLYARRLQADAPAGTPVEGDGGWTVK